MVLNLKDFIFSQGRRIVIGIPYVWMLLLFLLPFLIIIKYSLLESYGLGQFSSIFDYDEGSFQISLYLNNYIKIFTPNDNNIYIYILSFVESIKVALVSTLLCICIGYPLAWAITKCKESNRNILLLMVILPSWTAFLIRVYAWKTILGANGLLNTFLLWLNVIDHPLIILDTQLAVYIGIVYCYLPFSVLPIYASLSKIDNTLVEAALDLGCKPIKTFFTIIVPLTKGGVIAGGMLVFIPAIGEYVIPELLGSSNSLMIGKKLVDEFYEKSDWSRTSALAVVLLFIIIIPIIYFNKSQNKELKRGK